jgi:hypothetical protein
MGMSPTPDKKIKPLDIKDHADLMNYFVRLQRAVVKQEMYGWDHLENEITYLKAEIAHFLRIESPHQGVVADDGNNDPFRNSGGIKNDVKKNS